MSNIQTTINTSTSKQLFSFSKSERFPKQSQLNHNVAYDRKSQFDVARDGGGSRPFFHTGQRFSYYNSPGKETKHPSPNSYNLGNTFGNQSL